MVWQKHTVNLEYVDKQIYFQYLFTYLTGRTNFQKPILEMIFEISLFLSVSALETENLEWTCGWWQTACMLCQEHRGVVVNKKIKTWSKQCNINKLMTDHIL